MWSVKQVWDGANCTVSLLFKDKILKSRVIILNEQTFQQLQL